MNEEIKDMERDAEVPGNEEAEVDLKALNNDLQGRIGHLERSITARDSELSATRDTLTVTVAKYRAAVLASAPGIPEELVEGNTVEKIDASLALASGIVSKIRQQLDAEAVARNVPTGAPPRTPPDLSSLSPAEKIAYALSRQQT